MWGQHYDPKLARVFALQEEIAREITEKLRVKLTGADQKQLAKRPSGETFPDMQRRSYAVAWLDR